MLTLILIICISLRITNVNEQNSLGMGVEDFVSSSLHSLSIYYERGLHLHDSIRAIEYCILSPCTQKHHIAKCAGNTHLSTSILLSDEKIIILTDRKSVV
jgi:hypothetical protein